MQWETWTLVLDKPWLLGKQASYSYLIEVLFILMTKGIWLRCRHILAFRSPMGLWRPLQSMCGLRHWSQIPQDKSEPFCQYPLRSRWDSEPCNVKSRIFGDRRPRLQARLHHQQWSHFTLGKLLSLSCSFNFCGMEVRIPSLWGCFDHQMEHTPQSWKLSMVLEFHYLSKVSYTNALECPHGEGNEKRPMRP